MGSNYDVDIITLLVFSFKFLNFFYQVKVSALTVNGSVPSTGWLYASTFESDLDETVVPNPPSTLRAKAEDDSITIVWNPPSSKNILVRGYTIGWGKGIPDEYTKVVDNKQRYFVIEDLSKCLLIFCSYTFLLCNVSPMTPLPTTLDPRPCFPTSRPPLPIVPADRFTTALSAHKSTICRKQICP